VSADPGAHLETDHWGTRSRQGSMRLCITTIGGLLGKRVLRNGFAEGKILPLEVIEATIITVEAHFDHKVMSGFPRLVGDRHGEGFRWASVSSRNFLSGKYLVATILR